MSVFMIFHQQPRKMGSSVRSPPQTELHDLYVTRLEAGEALVEQRENSCFTDNRVWSVVRELTPTNHRAVASSCSPLVRAAYLGVLLSSPPLPQLPSPPSPVSIATTPTVPASVSEWVRKCFQLRGDSRVRALSSPYETSSPRGKT